MKYSTRDFTYNKNRKTFVTDASDIGFGPVQELILVSSKTQLPALFFLKWTVKDADGDTEYWEYWPSKTGTTWYPGLVDHRVLIFND